MSARIGRAAFWRFALLNLLVAAAAAYLLPDDVGLPRPHFNNWPLAPVPVKPLAAWLLLLPSGWMGMLRLRDAGKSAWQAWLPLIGFAAFTFLPVLLIPVLLQLVVLVQDNPAGFKAVQGGAVLVIALWLGALLLAAGILRTFFLWLQPGESDAAAAARPAKVLFKGRMARLPFWLLVAGNVALAYGISSAARHWPDILDSHWVGRLGAVLYLPTFIAGALRLQDSGRSGLLVLPVFLAGVVAPFAEPFLTHDQINYMNIAVDIAAFYLLYLCCQPGTPDENRLELPDAPEDAPAPQRAAPQPRPVVRTAAAPRSFGKRPSF